VNDTILGLLAFGLVLLTALSSLVLAYLRRKSGISLRIIPAYRNLRRAVGRVVEDGSRLHLSLGRGGLVTPQSASSLAGLALLRRLGNITSITDRPPIATCGESAVTLLAQSTLQRVAEEMHLAPDPSSARLTGLTPFSYAAGAIPAIRDENVSITMMMGNFGVEAALLLDACDRANVLSVAGSDHLTAQAVIYAGAGEPLIGEEVYAAGAYLESSPLQAASLVVQDGLRWLLIAILVGGVLLKVAGLL
jgi:hypothetical protein